MDVPRVVPDAGKIAGRAVEDDRPADEDESLDVVLDRAELVRHVDDRHAELRVQRGEKLGERLLGLGVDARRRLVEHEQRRLPGERLRDERPLLHAARQRPDRRVRDAREPDAIDRLGDEPTVVGPSRPTSRPDDSLPALTTSRTVAGASPPTCERWAR